MYLQHQSFPHMRRMESFGVKTAKTNKLNPEKV